MWGTLCAPSTKNFASTLCAIWPSSLTGLIVPSALDMCTTETNLVFSFIRDSISSRLSNPSSVIGINRILAPFIRASSCHGTRLLWCSIGVRSISSPSPIWVLAHEWATILRLSEALRVQISVSEVSALIKSDTFTLACSNISVASMLSEWTPRCTLALKFS